MPAWALIVPLGAAGLLAASLGLTVGPALAGACALALIGAVVGIRQAVTAPGVDPVEYLRRIAGGRR